MASHIQTYTTEGLRPAARIEYWNDCIGRFITSIETTPANAKQYNSRMNVTDCGCVTMVDATSEPACNNHMKKLIAGSTERMFVVHLQKWGQSISSQDGREALLHPGDFTLCDTARQFDVSFVDPHRILVVCIPESELIRRIPHVEDLMCIPMPSDAGINGVVSNLINRFWELCDQDLNPKAKERISVNFLDLLATAYANTQNVAVMESSLTGSRRLLIKEFIEQHLVDESLTPSVIARHLGYSTSYVHQVFKVENESISHYIIRRRVEKASKMLADDEFAGKTIGEIAYAWGFNSLTHFGRVFKARFGCTPTEYRRSRINDGATREWPLQE